MTKLEITTQAFEKGQKRWFLFEGLRSPYLAVHISVIIQNTCRVWIFPFPFGLLFTVVWKFQVLTLFSPKRPNIPYPYNKLASLDLIEVIWASDIYLYPLDPLGSLSEWLYKKFRIINVRYCNCLGNIPLKMLLLLLPRDCANAKGKKISAWCSLSHVPMTQGIFLRLVCDSSHADLKEACRVRIFSLSVAWPAVMRGRCAFFLFLRKSSFSFPRWVMPSETRFAEFAHAEKELCGFFGPLKGAMAKLDCDFSFSPWFVASFVWGYIEIACTSWRRAPLCP